MNWTIFLFVIYGEFLLVCSSDKKVWLTLGLEKEIVTEGMDISVKCLIVQKHRDEPEIVPNLYFCFYKDEQLIFSQKRHVLPGATLLFKNISEKDFGNYTCAYGNADVSLEEQNIISKTIRLRLTADHNDIPNPENKEDSGSLKESASMGNCIAPSLALVLSPVFRLLL